MKTTIIHRQVADDPDRNRTGRKCLDSALPCYLCSLMVQLQERDTSLTRALSDLNKETITPIQYVPPSLYRSCVDSDVRPHRVKLLNILIFSHLWTFKRVSHASL